MEIVKFLLTGGFITTAFVYLSKNLTDRFFARDLEKFKAGLEKELTAYKIQFGQLHVEKAQAIKEIFFQFHDIKKTLSELSNRITVLKLCEGKIGNEEYYKYDQKVVTLRDKIQKNSLFFREALTKEMLSVISSFQCALRSLDTVHSPATEEPAVNHKTEQYLGLVKLLDGSVLEPLKKEFKKILGEDL